MQRLKYLGNRMQLSGRKFELKTVALHANKWYRATLNQFGLLPEFGRTHELELGGSNRDLL